MVKKAMENVDSDVLDSSIGNGTPVEPKPTVQDVLLAKTQVDLELIQLIAETHRMVKELYERK